jgi:hypothetical protein
MTTASRVYTHVVADEKELEYASLVATLTGREAS